MSGIFAPKGTLNYILLGSLGFPLLLMGVRSLDSGFRLAHLALNKINPLSMPQAVKEITKQVYTSAKKHLPESVMKQGEDKRPPEEHLRTFIVYGLVSIAGMHLLNKFSASPNWIYNFFLKYMSIWQLSSHTPIDSLLRGRNITPWGGN